MEQRVDLRALHQGRLVSPAAAGLAGTRYRPIVATKAERRAPRVNGSAPTTKRSWPNCLATSGQRSTATALARSTPVPWMRRSTTTTVPPQNSGSLASPAAGHPHRVHRWPPRPHDRRRRSHRLVGTRHTATTPMIATVRPSRCGCRGCDGPWPLLTTVERANPWTTCRRLIRLVMSTGWPGSCSGGLAFLALSFDAAFKVLQPPGSGGGRCAALLTATAPSGGDQDGLRGWCTAQPPANSWSRPRGSAFQARHRLMATGSGSTLPVPCSTASRVALATSAGSAFSASMSAVMSVSTKAG